MTLAAVAIAAVYALGLWWFSTGAILWLDRRARTTYRLSMAVASVVAVGALVALVMTRDQTTPASAFVAFSAALAVWGWHELSFLTGLVTGPSVAPCPPGARGWRRFRLAAATLIHHEIALALTALAISALTLGSANAIGGWTFLVLFAARLSAKLNLFLGAPNFNAEFFPKHLRHLTSYLRRGPVSALFPLSIASLCAVAALAAWRAFDPSGSAFEATGFALVFSLTALAILEHAFMALPVRDTALWRWALPAAERAATQPVPAAPGPAHTPRGRRG